MVEAETWTDEPLTIVFAAGAVMDTVGPVEMEALFTVTVTLDDVVRVPALSINTAVKLCGPFGIVVVSQVTEYGAAVTFAPRLLPSNLNWTLATPEVLLV